jgi:Tfp pilus assembly protein PilF
VAAGVALLNTGRLAEAIEVLRGAVASHPGSPDLLRMLAFGYVRTGQRPWAVECARRAVALAPHSVLCLCQLSEALGSVGDRPGAIAAAEQAVSHAPQAALAHLTLAEALHPEGRPVKRDLPRAEHHVRVALELEPDNAFAHNELARIRLAQGRSFAAAGHLSDAVIADPQERAAHQNMDLVFVRAVQLAHYSIAVACVLFLLWGVLPWPRAAMTAACLATLALALGWVWVRLRRAVPRSLGAFLRGFARRDRLGTAWAAVVGLVGVILAVASVLPAPFPAVAGGGGINLLILGVVLSWIRVIVRR